MLRIPILSPILSLFVCFAIVGCARDQDPAAPSATDADSVQSRVDFVDDFVDAYFGFNPQSAISAGLHEYDGRLPDLSHAGIQRQLAWLGRSRAELEAWNASGLDNAQRFERNYLLAAIDRMNFRLAGSERPYTNPVSYGNVIGPDIYLVREYAPLAERLRAFIRYERALPKFLATMRDTLRLPLARPHVEVATASFSGYVEFFSTDIIPIFASVADETLQSELREANAAALAAFTETRNWLAAQLETANDGYALGAERFLMMLRLEEGVDITLEELKAAGERDLARNTAALTEACASYAPGESLMTCTQRMQTETGSSGPVATARRQLPGLREFVIEQALVTIPGDEKARVDEAPPYRRSNSAYIRIPGQFEQGLPSIYYIAPPDPSWSAEDQLGYIPAEKDLLFTSVHEVWPGHFLQNLFSNQTRIGNIFGTTTFSEGWAHYTEELMWEAGLGDGDPATHIGQLLNALLRNVRYLSAIGLHAEGMSVEESQQMFLDKAYQDFGNASQQARRGTYDPNYLGYTLGKLMIRKLRADWTASRGGRDAWQAFHDRLLGYGEPPLPLIRRDMLGENYTGDGRLLPLEPVGLCMYKAVK